MTTTCQHTGQRGKPPTRSRAVLRSLLGDGNGLVDLDFGGSKALVQLCLDEVEHRRRRIRDIGAVTDAGVLHDLWELPANMAVPAYVLSAQAEELLISNDLVERRGENVVRTYSAPGVVRVVAFTGAPAVTVRRAIRFTPIVRRYALVSATSPLPSGVLDEAMEWGVGLVRIDGVDSYEMIVRAAPEWRGVPSVYRWWLAELAYRSWLYDNTQPTSWAFGSDGPRTPAKP